MTAPNATELPAGAVASKHQPVLLLLFMVSGCAALIYEIVWFQLLEFVVGSSAVSLGVLLGAYMGGMCLGSLFLSSVVGTRNHPLRVYALLEAGIGLLGLLVLWVLPGVEQVYAHHVGRGLPGLLLRGLVCGVCLLPPTLLMGATLPAVSRWIETTPKGVSWLGFFYGGNIAGAVFGCLLAGFYLLRVHDMAVATFVAAVLNAIVALLACLLSVRTPFTPNRGGKEGEERMAASGAAVVYGVIACSGLCALGCEVIWTRLMSLLLGPTVYTFSIILAVFLVGLGIGSGLGSFVGRWTKSPRMALAFCQLFLTLAMGWTAWMLARSLPFWPINPSLSRSPWFNFQLDLARCFWAVLPPAILWGASFPLALAAVVSNRRDPGKLVGRVYAANTIGGIIGAVGTSVVLIGWLGTRHSQQILVVISALAGLTLLLLSLGDSLTTADTERLHTVRLKVIAAAMIIALVAAIVVLTLPKIPWQLIAYGRYLPTYADDRALLYVGEGLNSSVAVTEMSDGIRNFHVSGKVEASSDPSDMRLQRMLGDIPALLHTHPRSVLVVGCGAGVTAGSFTVYPGIERIVICEIEPLIPRRVTRFFTNENFNVLNDPRVEIVYDDARHYILTTPEKFDIITSDPIHPWVKGAATLYTKEYYEMVSRHLNPGGLVSQWVPLYESSLGAVKSEVATFVSVFPDSIIWSNDEKGQGYDTVLLGSAEPLTINVDDVQRRFERTDALARSLHDVGFWSAFGLLANYAGRGSELGQWLKGAEINRDQNLRLQFIAGLASDRHEEGGIHDDFIRYRQFPESLFTGSGASRQALREALQARGANK